MKTLNHRPPWAASAWLRHSFVQATAPAQTTPLDSARSRFEDFKVGPFAHWGLYSPLADGEWVMNNRGITSAELRAPAAAVQQPGLFDKWLTVAERKAQLPELKAGLWHPYRRMWRQRASICRAPMSRRPLAGTIQKLS